MASVTFAVDEKLKERVANFAWINLSELAREELIKQEETRREFEKFKSIVSKSKLTEEQADKLAEKVKLVMHKRLKEDKLL